MPADQLASDDYPYGRQPAAVIPVRDLSAPKRQWGPWIWFWLPRVAAISLVALFIVAAPISIVGYRASRQAAMVAELEQLGCRVSHSFDRTNDTALDALQGLFGPNGFADVSEVSAENVSPQDVARVAEICSRFKHLGSFTIVSNSFRFDQIASWKQLDNLHFLDIRSTNITDDDLTRIGRMPNLTSLILTSPHITDAGVHQLAGLPSLAGLELNSVQLTGGAPANPGGFPTLHHLAIGDAPRLNDQAIINLGPMPELANLVLYGTQVGDSAVAHLAKPGKLKSVLLGQTQITDAALAHLSKCIELTSVDLADTAVTDAGVIQLAPCALSNLNLSGTSVTGKGFGVLSGADMTLNLDGTNVSDDTLPELLQITGLSLLSLQNTKVTGASFPQRLALGSQLSVDLPGAAIAPPGGSQFSVDLSGSALTPQGFEALAKTNIPDLKLSRTALNDQQLMLFAANDRIYVLEISQTKVTAAGLTAFYEARKQRLEASGRRESLYVTSDFADIAEQYLPDSPPGAPPDEPEPAPDAPQPPQQPPPDSGTPQSPT
jgi:internalin A